MRFVALEVEDIFAYSGLSRVDFDACTDTRNIVVISGRNGAGKTSLLNAIKLLFLGAENDSLRRVSFGASPIGHKHFVLGQTGRWYGVFNTRAQGMDARARVALEWEDAGHRYRAERSFRRIASRSRPDSSARPASSITRKFIRSQFGKYSALKEPGGTVCPIIFPSSQW